MKKWRIAAGILVAASLLAGCEFSNRGSATELQADEEGKLIQIIAEKQDKSLDVDDLEQYIEDQIGDFNQKASAGSSGGSRSSSSKSGSDGSGAVKLDSCRIKDGKLQIRITYDGYGSYAAFNGVKCFLGTIADAKAAGYSFDRDFLNEKGKEAEDAKATIEERAGEWKVLITEETMRLRVPDKILYTSENMKTTGRMTAICLEKEEREESASGTDDSPADDASGADGSPADDASAGAEDSAAGSDRTSDAASGGKETGSGVKEIKESAGTGTVRLDQFVIDDFDLFYVIFK